jgi:hypothetical protein
MMRTAAVYLQSLFCLAVALLCFQRCLADTGLDFARTDHQLHGGVGFGATLLASEMLRGGGVHEDVSPIMAGILVMGVSFVKEWTDKEASMSDLQAAGVGIGSACVLSYSFKL